jgi:hypothetical protein
MIRLIGTNCNILHNIFPHASTMMQVTLRITHL